MKPLHTLRVCLAVAACLLLSSCGGGGSSGGNNNSSNFRVNISPGNLSYHGDLNDHTTLWLYARASGDPGVSTVYANAIGSSEHFRSLTVYGEDDSYSVQLDINPDLWVGTHTGEVVIVVCKDANCNTHLANSPYTIPYTLEVTSYGTRLEPVVDVDSAVVDYWDGRRKFTVVSVAADDPAPSVDFQYYSHSEYSLILPDNMLTEMNVSNRNDSGFTVTLPNRAPGVYAFEYQLRYGESTTPFLYTIYYLVGQSGDTSRQLFFLEDPVEFTVEKSGYEQSHSLSYIATGLYREVHQQMDFNIEYLDGFDWLWFYDSPSDYAANASVRTELLDAGDYRARVTATNFEGQSKSFDVIVHVTEYIYVSSPSARSFNEYTLEDETETLSVTSSDGVDGSWTASSEDPWIVFDKATGTYSDTYDDANETYTNALAFHIDLAEIAAMPNHFDGHSTFQIQDDNGRYPPKTVRFLLQKNFPEVTAVSPTQFATNQAFSMEVTMSRIPIGISMALLPMDGGDPISALHSETIDGTTDRIYFPAIDTAGTYELIFNMSSHGDTDYAYDFVPRPLITISD